MNRYSVPYTINPKLQKTPDNTDPSNLENLSITTKLQNPKNAFQSLQIPKALLKQISIPTNP